MANVKKRLPENVPGNLFVDATCINCDACRKYAPENFGDRGDFAYVSKQPETDDERLSCERAILSCPVGAIGEEEKSDMARARDSFPLNVNGDIYLTGFNHRDSYGADSYFVRSPDGNWLVDSPRFLPPLVKKFEEMGGLKYIFLTHRDDVGDAHKFAKHFGAGRIIHHNDRQAQKDAEYLLEGEGPFNFDNAEILFTPGHTQGHMVMAWQGKYLFTGDHFAWLGSKNRFGSFRNACWFSWEEQIKSVGKMAVLTEIEWVLPGHGKRKIVPKGGFPSVIKDSVRWMESVR